MKLADCLNKLGNALRQSEREAILKRAGELGDEAGAVNEWLSEAEGSVEAIRGQVRPQFDPTSAEEEIAPETSPKPTTEEQTAGAESPEGQGIETGQPSAKPPETPAEGQGEPTGIRNAIVDEARAKAALPERELPGKRSFGTIWDEAKATVAQDPTAGRRLVDELTKEVRPLTDTEDAILTYEQTQREAAQEAAFEAVNNAKTPEELESAQARLAAAQEETFAIYQVGQSAGTANARGLSARRLMINRDFSLARMLNETRAVVNEGKPLTPDQTAEITKLHERIKELETKLADTDGKVALKLAQDEYKSILRETQKEAKQFSKEKKSLTDFFDTQAEKARQRIIARRGKLNVTVDPLNVAGLVDEAIIGASYVARGVRDFTQWSKRMIEDFGERIKPHLDALFARASAMHDESAKTFGIENKTPEQILANAKADAPLEQKLVFDLARAHVNAGVDGFENVMKAVHADLAKVYPDLTVRQVHDAFSGYGKVRKPSKEEDLAKLREYRNLARLTSQLEDAEGGIAPKKTGPQRDKPTAKVRELQKKVSDAMRKAGLDDTGPDQIASSLKASKTRIRNAIEELQRKINANDYEPRPKRDPAIDKEKIDLEFQLSKVKETYQKGLIEAKRAKRSIGEKIWDTTVETANLARQILTSGDLPPVFRQGLFSIGRPVTTGKAIVDSFKAMVSEKQRFRIQQEIENRPNAPLYVRSKLYIAKEGQTLSQQEEAYMGNWFKSLPRWSVIGPFLRASERSYNTFLNKLRADTFDAMMKAYSVAPTDTFTIRRMADIINTMTGRARLPGRNLEQSAAGLNTFLFAARFTASRFKLVLGEPLWTGNMKTRAFALEQYARTLTGMALVYALAKTAGGEIETDPRSTDFGKIRFGDTRLDPMGGLLQVTTFLTRITTGETKTAKGEVKQLRDSEKGKANPFTGDTVTVTGRFLRSKLNPVAGTAINLIQGKDVAGKEVTPQSAALSMAVPISYQDIANTMEKQGVPKGTALWILSLFGMGLNTYESRAKGSDK